jgi:hypothetical protein
MIIHESFYLVASICAFTYAIITVISSWLHAQTKIAFTTLENVMAMRNDTRVNVRLWIVLLSFFIVLMAYAGVAARVATRSPGLALIGFSFCFIFVITELLWRSVDMFALRRVWLPQLAEEKDEGKKGALEILLMGFGTCRVALYFVLMTSCGLGTLSFGIGSWSENILDIIVSIVLFTNTVRLFLRVFEMHGGKKQLSKVNNKIYAPVVTVTYIVIGIWLVFP